MLGSILNGHNMGHDPRPCVTVVIADYNSEAWPKTWSDNVTEKVHVEALDAVTKIQEFGNTLMFGYVGTGLVRESARLTCYVVVRGLMFHPDEELIAFHDRI